MFSDNGQVIEYIKSLKGYQGYIQFSHRALEEDDIFEKNDSDIDVKDEKGFIYEAHFCNDKKSIMIRQQNAEWVVSTTDIVTDDKKIEIDFEYFALEKTAHLEKTDSNWVKMAQIWEAKPDGLCADMDVMKLQKVVFAGFLEKKGDVL